MAASMAERMSQAVRSWRHTDSMQVSANPADVESVTVRYLMYVLLPAWFLPGIADYMMHRRTRIERTSGLRESGIHALRMTEISVPLLLFALCEVNPLLLGIGTAAAGAHEATAIGDVRSAADGGREVRSAEQHIHSFLESLPFMAMSALLCLHWDQVTGAWQGRPGPAAWRLRLRRKRLPSGYMADVLATVTSLIAVPYAEELWRCARTRKR
jgi:hypothetical protein